MLFTFAETLTDPALVLAWFLSNLSASNVLIGLVAPLRDAGWFLPQLLTSHWLGRRAYKMPVYRAMAIVRVTTWVVITLAVLFLRSPDWLIAFFMTMYTVNSLAAGVAGLPFMDIVAKTIPPRQRGVYFGERLFWGGLLSIGGGYLVRQVLDGRIGLGFPANIGALMTGTTLISALGLLAFMQINEPPDSTTQVISLSEHLRRAWHMPGRDRDFGLYLVARIALIVGGVAVPFLTLYATRQLGASPGMLGIYLGLRTAASLVTNRLWSRWADRRSGRLVMQSSAFQLLAAMVMALTLVPLAGVLRLPSGLWPWFFAPVFVLLGSSNAAIGVAGSSLLLNLAPEDRRSVYVGFANTILGLALLFTGAGGLIVDLTGYHGIFLLAIVCCALSMVAAARVQEVRAEQIMNPNVVSMPTGPRSSNI